MNEDEQPKDEPQESQESQEVEPQETEEKPPEDSQEQLNKQESIEEEPSYQDLSPKEQQTLKDIPDEELNAIVAQLPVGKDGTVDLKDVVKTLYQRNTQVSADVARRAALDTFSQLEAEKKAWEDAFKEYPELRENDVRRNLVESQRIAAISQGKNLSPKQAASQLYKEMQAERQAGTSQAQESVRIQQAAHLETSGVQADAGAGEERALMDNIGSRDSINAENSRMKLLRKWMDDGKINV